MSNKTQLQTNNSKLDALITRVNTAKDIAASLPEAGSGGGSSGEENSGLCTVSITTDYVSTLNVLFYHNGSNWTIDQPESSPKNYTVACGSILAMTQGGYYAAEISGGEILDFSYGTGFIYQVPNEANGFFTINITTD